jgi:hypothetical protein
LIRVLKASDERVPLDFLDFPPPDVVVEWEGLLLLIRELYPVTVCLD